MIVVSACLLGKNCKYNGGNNRNEAVLAYLADKEYCFICPETLGGLPSPRPPAEQKDGLVIDKEGQDVTEAFYQGAKKALQIAQNKNATSAILKERSPSCGVHFIYDGSFQKKVIPGMGICAQMLKEAGIELRNEEEIAAIYNKKG